MTLEIIPVGGFGEIGRNCCAVKVDDEVVIFDMGLQMEKYIEHANHEKDVEIDKSPKTLMKTGALPEVNRINDLQKKVVAICIGHAHLDHVGAVPFLANKFDCPVYGTPFTIEVLKNMLKDEDIKLRNDIMVQKENSRFKVSPNIEIEFINVTHSTPESVLMAMHTKYGTVLYATDFKLDKHPTLGKKTNMKRLKEMNIKAMICDCLYANNPQRTPSEMIVKQMLKEILLNHKNKSKNIFITTFSSHIARLKSIKEFGKKSDRKVIFLGRSLSKYVSAAEKANVTIFKDVKIINYKSKVKKFLSKLKNTEKYLFVVTGHQGEPQATLSMIANENIFKFKSEDIVIFSSSIIPIAVNFENRKILEKQLKKKHIDIYKGIHVSGHASGEDHREFFSITKPQHLIPIHGDEPRMKAMKKIALEEGLKNIYLMKNHQRQKIQ
jgi:ribonuclease J